MIGTIGLLDVGKRLMRFSSWEDVDWFWFLLTPNDRQNKITQRENPQ